MRLNQVEPIRQAIFGGRLALARHPVALPSDKEPLTLGAISVKHHPVKDTNKVSLGLDQYQAVRLRRTTVERQGVRVLNVLHDSLLS